MGRKPSRRKIQPSFFKVLIGDFSKRLLIPQEFIKHFNRNLPAILILRSPNGKLWPVRVKKFRENWCFRRGWRKFARYHHLETGEFLVFRYNGDSMFRVTIFTRSACEKEMPSSTKRKKNSDLENGNSHLHTKKEEPETEKITIPKIVKEKPISHILKDVRGKKKKKKKKKKPKSSETGKSSVSKKLRRVPANKILRNGSLEAVDLLKTERPNFTQIMRAYARSMITVPKAIAIKNMFMHQEIAEIQDPQGRLWTLKVSRSRDGRTHLSNGLLEFIKGNNLEDGDACVFELIEVGETKNTMRVHIFRDVEQMGLGPSTGAYDNLQIQL